jgi:type II secretory pathway pseudopilin PulG
MARRRDSMAPYEIMGTRGGNGSPAPASDEPIEPRRHWTQSVRDLWDAGVPVVVRVPRGFAVLICVGVLALMVLAYWVGFTRGQAALRHAHAEQIAALDRAAGRIPGAGRLVEVPTPDLTAGPQGDGGRAVEAQDRASAVGDPRQPGLNYLILARYPREEADRLARFLAGRGVETAVIPTDNARFFHVVGLRGFTTDQYRAGVQAAYERQMRQLGRDWQASNAGRGHNLSDMYWRLYTGPG